MINIIAENISFEFKTLDDYLYVFNNVNITNFEIFPLSQNKHAGDLFVFLIPNDIKHNVTSKFTIFAYYSYCNNLTGVVENGMWSKSIDNLNIKIEIVTSDIVEDRIKFI